jgi:hypothetical protein
MANIALRNPQFKSIELTGTANSAVCVVKVNNIVRYTLIKNKASTGGLIGSITTLNFDISELARDYLEIAYQTNYVTQTVNIKTDLSTFTLPNGEGTVVDTEPTIEDEGFEAYGTFEELINPVVPFRNIPTFLMSKSSTTQFTILAPNNSSGKLPSITSSSGLIATSFSTSDTSITVDSVVCNIKRIDCTKYGQGNRIIYINKYGAQQDLWFFLKKTRDLARTNEGYKSNTITYPSSGATYEVKNAPNKVFNTQGKQSHTLSSGYYPEFANQFFEELLLSEFVWLDLPIINTTRTNIIPVKVKTSSMSYKTSVNDRLIEYTIKFEEAFDYINNIR